jgi:hypothetical protein
MKNLFTCFVCILSLNGFQLYSQNAILVENQKLAITNLGGDNYTVGNTAELRISTPITAYGTVNLTSDSGWLILDGVLPSEAIASHFSYISVNGQAAANNVNIRVTNYLRGCVIMPHTPTYEALTLYKDTGFAGDEMKCLPYIYYKIANLGSFDNTVSSFKLKKGYMATFAQNENGSGFSKVFIAENEDIQISALQVGLNDKVSFVRVFPWRYTEKKGFASGLPDFNRSVTPVKLTKSGWFYHWGTTTAEDLTDAEFVPMKWNAKSLTDYRWQEILDINYSNHLLGFNEPDAATQGNMTLDEMLLYWPKMMESGMRLGSPAPAGTLPLLYDFIDKCDELNYRVDFVAIHDYGEGTALAFYNKCKAVHDRTGRPIWITEFNSGGTWTNSTPTYPEISARIAEIMEKYDTEGIIERYAIFNFDEYVNNSGGVQNRAIFYTPAIPTYSFTPLGVVYRDNTSPMAFNPLEQIDKSLKLVAPQQLKVSNTDGVTNKLVWENWNYTGLGTIIVERSLNGADFQIVAILSGTASNYNDIISSTGFGLYDYRLYSRNTGFSNSNYAYVSLNINPNISFNVALNKSVSVNTVHSAPYPGEKAVDGNIVSDASRWVSVSGVFPAFIEIDLNGTFLIKELKLYTGYLGYNAPLTSFDFQYWNVDRWENIVSETTNTISAYSKIFTEVKTNKVRLYINSTAANIVRLYEIEVYGILSSSLSVNEFTSNKFTIYPNPTSDLLYISGNNDIETLEIFDLNGRQLFKKAGINSVDISDLSKGVYFIKLNGKETFKFIKK